MVAGLDELLQMFIDRAILVVDGWASQSRIYLFEKVLIVLGKDFQQGFVLHFPTQEIILLFLGSDIVIPLSYLLVFGIDTDMYLAKKRLVSNATSLFLEALLRLMFHKSGWISHLQLNWAMVPSMEIRHITETEPFFLGAFFLR